MSDFLGYKGKRVVVAGCFSGMGEATTKRLLSLGAEVHGLDFKESKLKLASFTQVDLRSPASIDAAAAKITGKVDALFNCAGLPPIAGAIDVMKVNYIGMRRFTELLLPKMSAGSAIACIASTAGLRWSTRIPVVMDLIKNDTFDTALKWCDGNMTTVAEGYSFSKEAVIVWTLMTSAHLIKRGIRLNCTLPGPTQTPMMNDFETGAGKAVIDAAAQPINRRATPDEQAGALVYLNSDAATYVNGVAFPVDGGFMGAMATGQIDMSAMMGGAAA